MNNLKKYTCSPLLTVKEAIFEIDKIGKKVVLITDESGVLLGIFTDGDMRKYILKNGDLSVPIHQVMNKKPIVFTSQEEVKACKQTAKMVVYPIVDEKNKLLDVIFWNDNPNEKICSNQLVEVPVVIMAGGKGTRLYPYTKILPKPLIPIGDLTITERIIEKFNQYGCREFHFVLNYKASMIKAYFSEIEKDYTIHYVEEKEYLGTGGGIALLEDVLESAFFVSNCDTIIEADYAQIYEYHKMKKNKVTMVCALRNIQVPYGVVALNEEGEMKEMMEKPSFPFLTNTGLYILEPEVIKEIEKNTFVHITDLIKTYLKQGERVGVYPISEKAWLDMGQIEELEKMMQALGIKN